METIEKLLEKIIAVTYGDEYRYTKDIFAFVDKIIKDDLLNTFKFEENKKELKSNIASVLVSISREIIKELQESKYYISHTIEFKNDEEIHIYFDSKNNKILSSRLDTYSTNDILLYHNKILQETVDFFSKKEVLNIFYEEYLRELSHQAIIETHYCRNMDTLLDLYNDPTYKEVRENSIFPALSDMAAENLSLNELKFKDIKEAIQAYEKDGSLETLAQLKKFHMIQAIKNTENCYNHEQLGKMLNETTLRCVKKIIIRRLAYLDAINS